MSEKKLYTYRGAVKHFNNIVANNWTAKTLAVSAKQASSNLVYQYKQSNGLANTARITLCEQPKLAS